MRVSGALMLASAGTPIHLIQLLGRWSSSAVERYVQHAPLAVVPDIPRRILHPDEAEGHLHPQLPRVEHRTPGPTPTPATPAAFAAPKTPPVSSEQFLGLEGQVRDMSTEIQSLRAALTPPSDTFVTRPRSMVVHAVAVHEHSNNHQVWQTRCGWQYGLARFYRVPDIEAPLRRCLRFPDSATAAI